jgi:inosine-uridine nucleoside N-ribohydrolase
MATQITIDTDCGYDDLLAISYLLADRNFSIDAITVVGGLCTDPQAGGNIIRYLVEQAGQPGIKVLTGVSQPQPGGNAPPSGWTDQVLHLGWPAPQIPAQPGAVAFLADRFTNGGGIVLAIGPFSNIAEALAGVPTPLGHFIAMGGALGNPPVGNIPDAPESEFNMYIDPTAASRFFRRR